MGCLTPLEAHATQQHREATLAPLATKGHLPQGWQNEGLQAVAWCANPASATSRNGFTSIRQPDLRESSRQVLEPDRTTQI